MTYPLPTFASAEVRVNELRATLAESKACIVKDFPAGDYDYLQHRIRAWGTPLLEARNLEGGMIYNVCIDHQSELPAYANTPYAFGFHTDCSEFEAPPDTVLLLCEQTAGVVKAWWWILIASFPILPLKPYYNSKSRIFISSPLFTLF